jgi:hypothetical protein
MNRVKTAGATSILIIYVADTMKLFSSYSFVVILVELFLLVITALPWKRKGDCALMPTCYRDRIVKSLNTYFILDSDCIREFQPLNKESVR